jgi:hypothetical protein
VLDGITAGDWLPPGKTAAVVFSIDDVHPSTSQDPYESGGDLDRGALGRARRLLLQCPELKLALSVVPDWRLNSLIPDTWVRHIPGINEMVHWARRHPEGRYRIDRHAEFVGYLNQLENCEVILHGLTHSHCGPQLAVEFQDEEVEECTAILRRGLELFDAAQVKYVRGFAPPAWNCPPSLVEALEALDFDFVISARDIDSAITRDAVTNMSGLKNVSLIYPQRVGTRGLVHISTNFQATSELERAFQVIDLNGVLHVKAHIFKEGLGHTMVDGLDDCYCDFLANLFTELRSRYGAAIWWTHLSELSARVGRAH